VDGLILIVEDDQSLCSTLEYVFQKEGYQTRTALSGSRGLHLANQQPHPDLVVLDIMLPDVSGTEVCRTLRATQETADIPVLILSARGDEVDRVVGFEVGADDYMTKPFSVRELLLRCRAILRRRRPAGAEARKLLAGPLQMDFASHQVWCDGEELKLTPTEFKLLTVVVSRRGRIQSREKLLNDVWGLRADLTTRTIDTHVKRLRHKLGAAGQYLETVRGVGYRFRTQFDESARSDSHPPPTSPRAKPSLNDSAEHVEEA